MTRKRKVGQAILPGHRSDPTGTDRLERGAMRRFIPIMRAATKAYQDALDKIPARPIAVNQRYEFRLDQGLLMQLLTQAGAVLDDLLFDRYGSTWLFDDYVRPAAERGARQAQQNLSRQASIPMADLINTEPYRLRMALLRAREFEEMQGLSAGIKADLSRILTEGIGRGLNPRDIARNLNAQTDISIARAHRIARTEIPNALRTARMEEDEQIMEDYGIRTMQMHFSALSPTTRESHAARHGGLFTIEQQQNWWSDGANSINCRCVSISLLVDADNKPLDPAIVERAKRIKQTVEARRG